jgi:hypothetical protein
MTVQVSISAHAVGEDSDTQKAGELVLLQEVRAAVKKFEDAGNEVYSATFSSQHHRSGVLTEDHDWS